MPRQRNNNIQYAIEVDTPKGECMRFEGICNLDRVAKTLNVNLFNGFEVVSRAMVSNWFYYPDQPRRNFASNISITKYELM